MRVIKCLALLSFLILASGGKAEAAEENEKARQAVGTAERPAGSAGQERLEDRRWIVKGRGGTAGTTKTTGKSELKWEGEQQKKTCSAYAPLMNDAFRKARYHSVQGDPCATMGYAKRFIELWEKCGKDCPEGYLQAMGYQEQTLRNVRILYNSGKERCLGKIKPEGPDAGQTTSVPSSGSKEQAR